MAETKGLATADNNKLAMSRALGAAFLNHQVEQLEKTVSSGIGSGNWRSRRQAQVEQYSPTGGRATNSKDNVKRLSNTAGPKHGRKKSLDITEQESTEQKPRRKSYEGHKIEKDADVVVVDASVLVHALYQVKKWCKEGRREKVIIPLEALNTLDILKKGTTSLAQRARAASRILEAQVGVNARIIVQSDDAFVLWDQIEFREIETDGFNKPAGSQVHGGSPEWVRRTICCAKWEVDKAATEENEVDVDHSTKSRTTKVVLAVSSPSQVHVSPSSQPVGLMETTHEKSLVGSVSPVPLPLPHSHTNRHEARSTGALVSHWAAKAGVEMLQVAPTLGSPAGSHQCPDDDERGKRQSNQTRTSNGGRGRRISPQGPLMTGHTGDKGLVERPQSVVAMHAASLMQPTRVVRVLARGEKLDP